MVIHKSIETILLPIRFDNQISNCFTVSLNYFGNHKIFFEKKTKKNIKTTLIMSNKDEIMVMIRSQRLVKNLTLLLSFLIAEE